MTKQKFKPNQIRQLEGAISLVQEQLFRNFDGIELNGEVCDDKGHAIVSANYAGSQVKVIYDFHQITATDEAGKDLLPRRVAATKVTQIPTALGNYVIPALKRNYAA